MTKRLKNANPDPRHSIVKGLLDSYWQRENPSIPSLPWGPADAGALGQFLRDNPTVGTDIVADCLDNRLRSEDHAPAERVHRWIGDVLRYAQPRPKHQWAPTGRARPGARRSPRRLSGNSWARSGLRAPANI